MLVYSLQGHVMVLWMCSLAVKIAAVKSLTTKEKLLWLFFIVSAPSNCSAVGVSVALGFALAMCCNSQLCTERNDFVNTSPQMVSGR